MFISTLSFLLLRYELITDLTPVPAANLFVVFIPSIAESPSTVFGAVLWPVLRDRVEARHTTLGISPFLLIGIEKDKGKSNRDETVTVFILITLRDSVKFLDLRGSQKYLSIQTMVTYIHFVPDTAQVLGYKNKRLLTEYPNNNIWLSKQNFFL